MKKKWKKNRAPFIVPRAHPDVNATVDRLAYLDGIELWIKQKPNLIPKLKPLSSGVYKAAPFHSFISSIIP